MITAKLLGGLGNQMFQYAVGRCLSIRNNTTLRLDISELLDRVHFTDRTPREFDLDVLNIKYTSLIKDNKKSFLGKIKNTIQPSVYITEINHKFNPNIFTSGSNVYLNGYWQNENYFKEIEDVIREDFSFKPFLDQQNQELLQRIQNTNSVSIHFRRGDYITNKSSKDYHGICTDDYYISAIQEL